MDTSALLEAWARYYPPDLFPRLWEKFDQLMTDGRLVAVEDVYRELARKEDSLHEWTKARKDKLFVMMDDAVQDAVVEILEKFPKMVENNSTRNKADPFVIALAKANHHIVVTAEKPSALPKPEKPKIPDVCKHFNIACISITDLIRREGWRF